MPSFAPAAPGGFGGAARTHSVAPATPPGPAPGLYSPGAAGFGGSAAAAGARGGSGLDVPIVPPPGAPGVAPAVQSGFSVPTAQAQVSLPAPVAVAGTSRKPAIAIGAGVAVIAIIVVIAVAASGGGEESTANAGSETDDVAATPDPKPARDACRDAAASVRGNLEPELAGKRVGKAALARIGMAIERHCKGDAWSPRAIACFTEATSDADNGTCLKMISDKQQDSLIKHIDQIVEEDKASRAPPEIGGGSAVAVAAGTGSHPDAGDAKASSPVDSKLPSACADYRAQLGKLKRCRRVPRRVRHGFETEYALIVKSWKETPKTEALREATEKVCAAGTRSVLDLRKTHCRR